jgi:2'-5' RNA ligase
MNAVVSLLDAEHTVRVGALWEELERDFGVRDARERVSWPHFTYQGAETYDVERVEAALRQIAGETPPFFVHAEGLGIFVGPQPVLYLPVVRKEALNHLHMRLWEELAPLRTETSPYYAPERWMAHITLAQWDLSPANLPAILQRLAARPLAWRIRVESLALITGVGAGTEATYTLHGRYSLAGPSTDSVDDVGAL